VGCRGPRTPLRPAEGSGGDVGQAGPAAEGYSTRPDTELQRPRPLTGIEYELHGLVDLLGVNEWQEGQERSSKRVRALMSDDCGHLRTMRLLPFTAAAPETGTVIV
jgi:hypothetical protein